MDLKIKQREIHLTKTKLEISPETFIENGSEVTLLVKGSVVKIEEKNNQDGTRDLNFIVKAEITELK
jgi:hypothetical protein